MSEYKDIDQLEREKYVAAKLDELGREVPDPTPIAPPVGYVRRPSLAEQIREMVRSETLRQAAENAGLETFEEADDFDIDDFDPSSPYEEHFDPTPIPELRRRLAEAEAAAGQGSETAGGGAVGGLDALPVSQHASVVPSASEGTASAASVSKK